MPSSTGGTSSRASTPATPISFTTPGITTINTVNGTTTTTTNAATSIKLQDTQILSLQKFIQKKEWIDQKVEFLKSLPDVEPFVPDPPERSRVDKRTLEEWWDEHDRIEREAQEFDEGELKNLRKLAKAASQKDMSPSDTDLVEITLTTLFSLDKLLHSLRHRSKALTLMNLRHNWQDQLETTEKERKSLITDLPRFMSKARWTPPPEPPSTTSSSSSSNSTTSPRGRKISATSAPAVSSSGLATSKLSNAATMPTMSTARMGIGIGIPTPFTQAGAGARGGFANGSTSSLMSRTMRSEILSLDLAHQTSRITSLLHSHLSTTAKTLDTFIDTSPTPVPESFLDVQERVEDDVKISTDGLGKFLGDVVAQWRASDELFWGLKGVEHDSEGLKRDIDEALLKLPESKLADAFEGRVGVLEARLEGLRKNLGLEGDWGKSSSSSSSTTTKIPMPKHALVNDQVEFNEGLLETLGRICGKSARELRGALDNAKVYRKAARALEKAKELQREMDGCSKGLVGLVRDIEGLGVGRPDLRDEGCLQSGEEEGGFVVEVERLEGEILGRVQKGKGFIMETGMVLVDLQETGVDPNLRRDLRDLMTGLQETIRRAEASLVRRREEREKLALAREVWGSAERCLERIREVRGVIAGEMEKSRWSAQKLSKQPEGLVVPDVSGLVEGVRSEIEERLEVRREEIAGRFLPGHDRLHGFLELGISRVLNKFGGLLEWRKVLDALRDQRDKVDEVVAESQAMEEELEAEFKKGEAFMDGGRVGGSEGEEEGKEGEGLDEAVKESRKRIEELGEKVSAFNSTIISRIPFVSTFRSGHNQHHQQQQQKCPQPRPISNVFNSIPSSHSLMSLCGPLNGNGNGNDGVEEPLPSPSPFKDPIDLVRLDAEVKEYLNERTLRLGSLVDRLNDLGPMLGWYVRGIGVDRKSEEIGREIEGCREFVDGLKEKLRECVDHAVAREAEPSSPGSDPDPDSDSDDFDKVHAVGLGWGQRHQSVGARLDSVRFELSALRQDIEKDHPERVGATLDHRSTALQDLETALRSVDEDVVAIMKEIESAMSERSAKVAEAARKKEEEERNKRQEEERTERWKARVGEIEAGLVKVEEAVEGAAKRVNDLDAELKVCGDPNGPHWLREDTTLPDRLDGLCASVASLATENGQIAGDIGSTRSALDALREEIDGTAPGEAGLVSSVSENVARIGRRYRDLASSAEELSSASQKTLADRAAAEQEREQQRQHELRLQGWRTRGDQISMALRDVKSKFESANADIGSLAAELMAHEPDVRHDAAGFLALTEKANTLVARDTSLSVDLKSQQDVHSSLAAEIADTSPDDADPILAESREGLAGAVASAEILAHSSAALLAQVERLRSAMLQREEAERVRQELEARKMREDEEERQRAAEAERVRREEAERLAWMNRHTAFRSAFRDAASQIDAARNGVGALRDRLRAISSASPSGVVDWGENSRDTLESSSASTKLQLEDLRNLESVVRNTKPENLPSKDSITQLQDTLSALRRDVPPTISHESEGLETCWSDLAQMPTATEEISKEASALELEVQSASKDVQSALAIIEVRLRERAADEGAQARISESLEAKTEAIETTSDEHFPHDSHLDNGLHLSVSGPDAATKPADVPEDVFGPRIDVIVHDNALHGNETGDQSKKVDELQSQLCQLENVLSMPTSHPSGPSSFAPLPTSQMVLDSHVRFASLQEQVEQLTSAGELDPDDEAAAELLKRLEDLGKVVQQAQELALFGEQIKICDEKLSTLLDTIDQTNPPILTSSSSSETFSNDSTLVSSPRTSVAQEPTTPTELSNCLSVAQTAMADLKEFSVPVSNDSRVEAHLTRLQQTWTEMSSMAHDKLDSKRPHPDDQADGLGKLATIPRSRSESISSKFSRSSVPTKPKSSRIPTRKRVSSVADRPTDVRPPSRGSLRSSFGTSIPPHSFLSASGRNSLGGSTSGRAGSLRRVSSSQSLASRRRPNLYKANPNRKLDVEVGRIVNQLPVPVTIKIADSSGYEDQTGRYWIGHPDPRLCFCRILRSQTVMVRVGGGWQELGSFLLAHFGNVFSVPFGRDASPAASFSDERWISSHSLRASYSSAVGSSKQQQANDSQTTPMRMSTRSRSSSPSPQLFSSSPNSVHGGSPGTQTLSMYMKRHDAKDSPPRLRGDLLPWRL